MTEALMNRYRPAVQPLLEPGEDLVDVAKVIPAAGAEGVGDGAGAAIGNALARIGAVTGESGSIARSFPKAEGGVAAKLLVVTDRRTAFVTVGPDIRKVGRLLWHVPRSVVARVERRPRLQAMARFRLCFADGSAVSMYTMRRRTVEALADHLGR
ncbi:hypothetical protein ACIG0C_12600 [Kitasatospora aureofaciens]|uniref:Uncharacterized protein n=2 Tax=Kitasatospora aureofaciens TaxID=1894 RepID=A0A8H9LH05_KITAU|nr:hypothetical protein [Kitasatospora aureofaciens]UKZ09669.1 hypothetical protein BOQ63_037775 [Streptomyces viridifaciens]GGU58496.1 hypothetical protein GCM10010502_06530 [Kitasatospora aureofaciens]HJD81151.1 hypothetical protein [Kitasatospora aureofaciens]